MSALAHRRTRPALASMSRGVLAAVLASALAAGCDDTLEPFQENANAVFSMFGYLDLNADTQWVRVMPVRQNLFLDPDPIDAVVTLEHPGSGRIVTLNDSLFRFPDPRLGGEAFAHNFWTTERLQPEASYRLVAARSDGASTTAIVVMPPEPELLSMEDTNGGRPGTTLALFRVRPERVLLAEVLYGMGRWVGSNPPTLLPTSPVPVGEYATFPTHDPGTIGIYIVVDTLLIRPGLEDIVRREIRIAVARSDWPYHAELSDLEVTVPNIAPSNVESGLGFVGGVATWTIPFDACETLAPRPDGEASCATRFNARSASIAGRVIREPCGDPHLLAPIQLTVNFAGGGGVLRTWKTGWYGEYRFDGIEANAELHLQVGSEVPAVQLPRLAEGEHYTVQDLSVLGWC